MKLLWTLAAKDLRLLLRDRLGLFWALGFPLIMALMLGAIFGGGGDGAAAALPVALIDAAGNDASRALAASLSASPALEVQADIQDAAAAQAAVRRGTIVACIVIDESFTSAFALFGGGQAAVEVSVDPARKAEAGFLQGVLMQAAFQSLQGSMGTQASAREQVAKTLADLPAEGTSDQSVVLRRFLSDLDGFLRDVDDTTWAAGPFGGGSAAQDSGGSAAAGSAGSGLGLSGIKFVEVARSTAAQPRSAYDITFPSAILWGLLGCSSTFALGMVKERTEGTLLRLRAAPLSLGRLLAGKALGSLCACLGVMTALLLLGRFGFGVRIGSLPFLALAMGSAAACFTGLMMLLSVLGRTPQGVSGAGWGLNVVMAMFGGGMIPLLFMPGWMRVASHFSPVKWGILALEGATWREFTATEMALPCGILLAVGVVAFTAGVALLSRREA